MGKPRQKQTYSPELIENLRFRFEETGEPVRTIAVSVPMARTTLYALAQERGWTRFVRPPLDLTPAARLAAEAGKLAAEAGRPAAENLSRRPEVPSRSDGLEGPVTQRPFEGHLRRRPQGNGTAASRGSQVPEHLGPDGDHADEERERSERGSFLNEGLDHVSLPERKENIVRYLFSVNRKRQGGKHFLNERYPTVGACFFTARRLADGTGCAR